MKKNVLLDTGPLVASINKKDNFHDWAARQLGDIEPPLLTCEAVLAEACFLLRHTPKGSTAVVQLVNRKIVEVPFRVERHARSLNKLINKYLDLPMSFADACLVRMSELYDTGVVMTLDNHFRIYRRHGRRTVPVLMPSQL